ncbi:MAG: glycosyltransferase family 4 protein [Candidatus Dormibacteria bacterium]
MPEPASLRVALLTYRGNPNSGGQGVYVRHLSRSLTALGHHVEVFSGQPYPRLDPGIELVRVAGLDLYNADHPFRVPRPSELKDWIDELEWEMMRAGRYPEPLTFSHRVRRLLRERVDEFDVVHDNQVLATGIRGMQEDGHLVMATMHHPLAVDREQAGRENPGHAAATARWYDFLSMQDEVARGMPLVLTVSESAGRDIVERVGLDAARIRVTPLGVDTTVFRPRPGLAQRPGRVFTMAAAHIPLKGLRILIEALAIVRRARPDAHLVVVSRPWKDTAIPGLLANLGLEAAVTLLSDVSDERLGEEYALSELAVVPSLYEGFSLPAVQAMASGVALVGTTAGALPEVVGDDGSCATLVPPGEPASLAEAITALLADPARRTAQADAGRERVLRRYDWRSCGLQTVAAYRELLEGAGTLPVLKAKPPRR